MRETPHTAHATIPIPCPVADTRRVLARYPDGILTGSAERWLRIVERELLRLLETSTSSVAVAPRVALACVFSWYPEQALAEECRSLARTLRAQLEHALGDSHEVVDATRSARLHGVTPICSPSSSAKALTPFAATEQSDVLSDAEEHSRAFEDQGAAPLSAVGEAGHSITVLAATTSAPSRVGVVETPTTTSALVHVASDTRAMEPVAETTALDTGALLTVPAPHAMQGDSGSSTGSTVDIAAPSNRDARPVPLRDGKHRHGEATVSEIVDQLFTTQVLTRWSAASTLSAANTGAPQESHTCPVVAASASAASLPTAAPTSSNRTQTALMRSCESGYPSPNATEE